ncbi:hypothetical protein [Neorhizobium alkalisoli]|uniref:hypothetical protein n=1 Tax=Neorhizobium alkalisoli TaxID=528178 RepID=UPI000CF98B5D|nr:hypothetical protein [Neorhizobium alkalisoli]
MTKITSAIAAALIASASFASVALAEGNYYEGVTPPSAGQQHPAAHRGQNSAHYGYTGSISRAQDVSHSDLGPAINSGDYYAGVNRPN